MKNVNKMTDNELIAAYQELENVDEWKQAHYHQAEGLRHAYFCRHGISIVDAIKDREDENGRK